MKTKQTQKHIPNGWVQRKVGVYGACIRGVSYSPSDLRDNKDASSIALLRSNNIKNEKLNLSDIQIVSRKKVSSEQIVKAGDIFICMSSGSKSLVGKNIFFEKDLEYTIGAFCALFRPDSNKIIPPFVKQLFLSRGYIKQIQDSLAGTSINNLKNSHIEDLQFLFPSKKEQQKIAEILWAVDEDIVKTQEVIDITEKLKKGLMQEFFSKSNVKDKNWGIVKLQDVCKVRQGLQIPIKKRFKEGGENRFIYITLKYLKALENVEYIENPSKSVICEKEDILMTRTGNTGIVVTNVSGVFHNNFFLVDFDRKKIIKDFLVYYLRSDKIQKNILDKAGITTIPDINHGDFYSIDFVMPPIEEQQKIAEILSAVDEKISVNKKLKAKLTQLKKGLMQDLLSGNVRVINN